MWSMEPLHTIVIIFAVYTLAFSPSITYKVFMYSVWHGMKVRTRFSESDSDMITEFYTILCLVSPVWRSSLILELSACFCPHQQGVQLNIKINALLE